jgi:hypothetical protein
MTMDRKERAAYFGTLFALAVMGAPGASSASERVPANATAFVADRPLPTRTGAAAVLDSPAMNAMLRADRNKDGLLSREELDEYDLALGRRFSEADADHNGRLTLPEFETLFAGPDGPSVGATR